METGRTIKAELFRARCDTCGSQFEIARAVGDELLTGRTQGGEVAVVSAYTDPVFDGVSLVTRQILAEWMEIKRGEAAGCIQKVFGYACDDSPRGFRYDFSGTKWCPVCDSTDIDFGPYVPGKFTWQEMPFVDHQHWAMLNPSEKRTFLTQALQEVGCLPCSEDKAPHK